MFKFVTAKSIGAVAAAALVTSLAAFWISVVPEAKAESRVTGSQVKAALYQPHAKSDRHPAVVKATACPSRSWPHYEQSCQFDLRRPANEARTIRVIALR